VLKIIKIWKNTLIINLKKLKNLAIFFNLLLFYKMSDLDLFPVINPNIGEVIERENAVAGEDLILDDEIQPSSHNEIFSKSNVKLQVSEPVALPKKKDKYAHLAEARKKGALTRQKKAEAKRALKAEAKAIKDEEKRLRREATQERNRVKARERYRSQKAKKDEQAELKEKIRLESEAKKKQQEVEYKRYHQKPPQDPVGMNFEKFAGYMMRYEGLKQQYAQQQRKPPPPPKQKSEFPEHYPLANLYKKNKDRKADFSNF
tara:strand:+ start:16794 stop:17573 length:780 start_codon:yes stop_codon:yes gene_type:complete